jgi:hypothetical protein
VHTVVDHDRWRQDDKMDANSWCVHLLIQVGIEDEDDPTGAEVTRKRPVDLEALASRSNTTLQMQAMSICCQPYEGKSILRA